MRSYLYGFAAAAASLAAAIMAIELRLARRRAHRSPDVPSWINDAADRIS